MGANILIFNGDMSRGGGTERIAQVLSNQLAYYEDYNVFVVSCNNEKGSSFYPLDDEVCHISLHSGSIYKKITELSRVVKERKIDVIIDVDVSLGLISFPVGILNPSVKIISWEMFNIRNNIGNKYIKPLRRIAVRKSAYYINQTKGDMDAFLSEMRVKCPITYIYNPCSFDSRYNDYDLNSKIIITAGHFFYDKGFDLAVDVAEKVFQKYPDWKWIFYGDGLEMEAVRNSVFEKGLQENIVFAGRVSNLQEEMKKAAMYVMTSRTEGFGLVLTEAKACNLPTIAFDVDFGPREIIEDSVSGFLISSFNTMEMAEKICMLIEDENLRKNFSMHAKDNCDKFSIRSFVDDWIGVLKEINNKC